MLRGYRKIYFKFAKILYEKDQEMVMIVKKIKKSNSKKGCSGSKAFIKWLDDILNHFDIDRESKKELVAIFISFIFKSKTESIIGKISDDHPRRFKPIKINSTIKNFK